MKTKLEDVLKEKERELKLHQRFLNLKTFCEKKIFPDIGLPLQQHIETLKGLIEKIIPDPKERAEEMFSGEIFALLATVYLHDIKHVKDFEWSVNKEIFNAIDGVGKEIFLNYEIGKKLDIPASAIEIINYLGFSNTVKKIPVEWEIVDNGSRAIIRNTKTFEHIFNFVHLLVDLFCTDLRSLPLKRYKDPQIILRPNEATIDIDSREGVITIRYSSKFPYEQHAVESARRYVDNMFTRFKNNVNGRMGFQYKEIIWDITSDFSYNRDIFETPKFSPYNEFEGPPFERWDEAERILDRLFDYGYAVVVGDVSAGKTTVLKSFVMPQLQIMNHNVFYCEAWSHPADAIRDAIKNRVSIPGSADLDVISLCKRLSGKEPCFFIIDSMERLIGVDTAEKEKVERFFDFCRKEENFYLVVCGDKETFFEWHLMLREINIAALYQLKSITDDRIPDESKHSHIGVELLQTNRNLERILEEILSGLKDLYEFRSMVAFFINRQERTAKRHSMDEIRYETSLPDEDIFAFLTALKEKDILKETESQGIFYYSLTSRYLREPLYKALKLNDFDARRKVRTILKKCIEGETFLNNESLTLVDVWKDRMMFSKDEMGLILGSFIACDREYGHLFEKAKKDGRGIEIQPILKLIRFGDVDKRIKAVRLLISIRDKAMINPLLLHLKEEDVFEIRDLVVKGIELTGKKKAIIAIINTLRERGDNQLRLEAIEFLYTLFGDNSRQALIDIRETEEDRSIVKRIDQLLSKTKPPLFI
jgi:hypothetical protein